MKIELLLRGRLSTLRSVRSSNQFCRLFFSVLTLCCIFNSICFAQTALSPATWTGGAWPTSAGASTWTSRPGSSSPGSSAINISQWNRGSGCTYTPGGGRYNTVGFTQTSAANALNAKSYFFFIITNNSATAFSMTSFGGGTGQRSSTGPNGVALYHKMSGTTTPVLIGTGTLAGSGASFTQPSFTPSSPIVICPGKSDTFYYCCYGASGSGTYGLSAGQAVNGNWVAGPSTTASNLGPVIAGASLLFASTTSGGVSSYNYAWAGPSSYASTVASPSIASAGLTDAGIYTLTVTDAWGCSTSDTTLVTVNPSVGGCSGTVTPGTASATSVSFCDSGSTLVRTIGATLASDIVYTWQSSTDSTIWSTIAGATSINYYTPILYTSTYFRMLTYCASSSSMDSTNGIRVNIYSRPTISVTPSSDTFCVGSSGISLVATGAGSGGTYTWSPAFGLSGSTGSSVTANGIVFPTIYTVTGTDALTSCTSTAVASIGYTNVTGSISPANASICSAPGQLLTPTATVYPISPQNFEGTLSNYGWTVSGAAPWIQVAYTYTSASTYITNTRGNAKFYVVGGSATITSYLTTPSFSLVGLGSASLSYDQFYDQGVSTSDSANVSISIDGGTTWNSLYRAVQNWIGSASYNMALYGRTISLNAYVGQPNVKIRFGYFKFGSSTAYFYAIDNVTISGTPISSSYSWSPATGLSSTTGAPIAVPAATTVYTASVEGCPIGQPDTITVLPLPYLTGSFTASPSTLCPLDTLRLTFSGTSTGTGTPVSYNYSGPAGFIDTTSVSISSTYLIPTSVAGSGVYSCSVTYTGIGCVSAPLVTGAVTVNAPLPYTVTGGAGCVTSGVVVGLSSSDTGISYQLYNRSTAVGAPITGTGSAIVFNGGSPITTEGVYYVKGNNGSCDQLMYDSAIVYNGIASYSVLGNGVAGAAGCASTGVIISLASSQAGVIYQLYRDTTRVDTPRIGTGGSLLFNAGAAYSSMGRYTVVGSIGGCTSLMSNAVLVYDSINTYNVTTANACSNNGMRMAISGSDTGVLYTVYCNGVTTVLSQYGHGSSLALDSFNTQGRYSVIASASGGCTRVMRGYATIYSDPVYSPSPSTAHICDSPGSTISIPSGSLTILSEAFESAFESRGWSSSASTPSWAITTSPFVWTGSSLAYGAAGNKFVILDDRIDAALSTYLTTPTFTLAGLSTASVSFKYFFNRGTSEAVTLEISTDGGATWPSTIFTAPNNWIGSRSYTMTTASISLTAFIGRPNVRLRFKYFSPGTDSYLFAADDFKVSGTPLASSYTWAPADGLSATTGATVTAIPTVTTVYTVTMTNCPITTSNTSTVNVYTLPSMGSIVASPASYCAGTDSITLVDTATHMGPAGATFTRYNWSGPAGYTATSLGSTTTLAPTTTAASGSYSVSVTYSYPGCTSVPAASDSITVNLGIIPYVMTGRDTCASLGGVFGLDTSTLDVSYVLWRDTIALDTILGTGSVIAFDTQFVAGVYTIRAFNAGGCTGAMLRSVSLSNGGTIYAVTGGSGCSNAGLHIGLSGSQASKNYQLLRNGSPFGLPLAGTDSVLGFGLISDTGLYQVLATDTSGSGCSLMMSGSARVGYAPIAHRITGGDICSSAGSIAIGVDSSELGVLYQLFRNDSALSITDTGTGSVLSLGTHSISGSYNILATGTWGCTTTLLDSANIYIAPACSLGANPLVCQLTSRASMSYTGLVADPTLYSIYWDTTATDSGFVQMDSVSLASYIGIDIPAGVVGVYHGTLVLHNAHCTSAAYGFNVQILPTPMASITAVSNPCLFHIASITITGTSSADIIYSIAGGASTTATLTGGSYSFFSMPITAPATFRLIDAHNMVCATTIDSTLNITPTTMSWIGGAAGATNNWNTAANWSCGFVPTITDSVVIPNGYTFEPRLLSYDTAQVGALVLNTGAAVVLDSNACLQIARSMVNNDSIQGAGSVYLNGTQLQSIKGMGVVQSILLNNLAGAEIDSASRLTIVATLGLQRGNLYTNDSLVLSSEASITARVLPLSDSCLIIGNTKVLQYIPGGRRAYRFWAHPFSNSIDLSQLQSYIDITGPGGSVNGFTTTGSNAPSAFRYNPLRGNATIGFDPGWMRISSAFGTVDSNRFHPYQGLRIFYRGSKGEGLGYVASYVPSSTTTAFTGALNQGTQVIRLAKGSDAAQDYNMVGNPYASPIDIGTIVHEAKRNGNVTGAAYYIWNPYLATVGQYQAIPVNATATTPYYLQANASFQVRAAHHNDSLIIRESHKVARSTTTLLKSPNDRIVLHIYDLHNHLWDMLHIAFNEEATSEVDDDYDALKLLGPDFNFYALTANGKQLAIVATTSEGDSAIALGWQSNYQQQFVVRVAQMAALNGQLIYLHDKALNTYMLLQQGAEYTFQAQASTPEHNRFEIVWRTKDTEGVSEFEIHLTPNPTNGDAVITWTPHRNLPTQVTVYDIHGARIYNATISNNVKACTLPASAWPAGTYMVHCSMGNNKIVRKLIKQ